MDIKNIYEKFSSSVSNPNIIEHFETAVEENSTKKEILNEFIDKLSNDPNISETEKFGLQKIKSITDPKEQ